MPSPFLTEGIIRYMTDKKGLNVNFPEWIGFLTRLEAAVLGYFPHIGA